MIDFCCSSAFWACVCERFPFFSALRMCQDSLDVSIAETSQENFPRKEKLLASIRIAKCLSSINKMLPALRIGWLVKNEFWWLLGWISQWHSALKDGKISHFTHSCIQKDSISQTNRDWLDQWWNYARIVIKWIVYKPFKLLLLKFQTHCLLFYA